MINGSKVILGTSQFGSIYGNFAFPKATDRNNIIEILNICKKNKIKQVDTSPVYGDFFNKNLDLSEFLVDTKIYLNKGDDLQKSFYSALESTILSLKLKKINVLYLHNPHLVSNSPRDLKILDSLFKQAKSEGLINKVGVSIYDIQELDFLIDYISIDVLQLPMNFIDYRIFKIIEYIKGYKKHKMLEVYSRSIFLQGILLNINKLPETFSNYVEDFKHINQWYKKHDIKALDACISFVHNCKILDKFIIGVQTLPQLHDILNAKINTLTITDYPKIYDKNILDPRKW